MIYVPLFVTSILSIFCTIPALFWHARHKNVPALCFIVVLQIQNVFVLVNSIPWGSDDTSTYWDGKGYCDIATRVFVAGGVAIVSCLVAISRNLANIMAKNVPLPTANIQRRKLIVDLCICFIPPSLIVIFYYFYQPYRYEIIPRYGCMPSCYPSWVMVILYSIWAPILALVASVYSMITLVRYFKRRRELRAVLSSSQTGLTVSRFARLLVFAFSVILVAFPLSLYLLYTYTRTLFPYSWSLVHNHERWSTIPISSGLSNSFITVWLYFVCSIFLFLIFGIGREATSMYIIMLRFCGLGKIRPFKTWLSDNKLPPSHSVSSSAVYATSKSVGTGARPTRFDTWENMDDQYDIGLPPDFLEKYQSHGNNAVVVYGGRTERSGSTHSDPFESSAGLGDRPIKVTYEVRVE
ncbi:pheromone A receptor-domain-containing protein [Lipomyces japonicus]|uniref:pheromone A receptor-domain-containing protein n=1 Tax=Lipomyces japonicus TaxID=56871 RepID=UPI0034CF7904